MNKQQQRALLSHRDVPYTPVPAATLAEWPPGTFPENLAATPDGSWLISQLSHNRIDRVNPDGSITVLAMLPVAPLGIAIVGSDAYVVAGTIGQDNWRLYRISLTDTGAELVCKLPHLRLGNGLAAAGRHLLVVDSYEGTVTRIDPETGDSSVWLDDDLLRSPYPEHGLPGVNGIAVDNDVVYLTNTSRSLLLRTPLVIPSLSVVAAELVGDGFARHPDGSFYVATHLHDSVLHVKPDGSRSDVARGLENTTAVALDPLDPRFVCVTTAGEDFGTRDGIKVAMLVRLQVSK